MTELIDGHVYSIDRIDVQVAPGPLGYAQQHALEIAAHWRGELAANPTLFNGALYLAPHVLLEDGVLHAGFVRSLYETLLYWRRDPDLLRPWHIFGVGVIVSAEGDLIAGRMAAHNAGAGRIYFPAGSIDDSDIVDGKVDYQRNMRREVLEETGLDLHDAVQDTHVQLVTGNRSIALFQRYQFAETTQTLLARICANIETQDAAELDAIIPIRMTGEMGEATPSYVRAFADWHFTNSC
ncbi:NUDIX hydrolase [Paraburkholderia aspalathi]|nr:NUDIX hydrolase [Paraburkholderia aspalathi]